MSNEKKTVISEATLLPISFVILILIGVVRVESTASSVTHNTDKIQKLEKKIEVLEEINTRLSRIEGALGVKTDEDK